ncbi:Lon protease C-terminal proteolytic domain-containing protein [Mycena galericulata]|nr:Lon protease C-terminal proteolytic domain-containing protein [Mycena galericulata]
MPALLTIGARISTLREKAANSAQPSSPSPTPRYGSPSPPKSSASRPPSPKCPQKSPLLRQQLAAIHKELQSLSGDDLADLKCRIETMAPGSEERKMGVRENGVIQSYLEWLIALGADHFGLGKIKKRLIEYLAVGGKGPILLSVGPPGMGKTFLGQSVAKALDQPFQRTDLAIRGHRRTYVASGPGLIVQAMRNSNFHGDDPKQNRTFNDYINVPIDLSQLSANPMDADHVQLTEPALMTVATQYTHEAGVRSLERDWGGMDELQEWETTEQQAGAGSGVDIIQSTGGQRRKGREYSAVVEENELEGILGIARYDGEERRISGSTLEELIFGGAYILSLVGEQGERGDRAELGQDARVRPVHHQLAHDPLKVPKLIDTHLHLPADAQKKDGPSAWIAMICAFVSLLTGARVPTHIAMTGKITLRGRVTPVGGIKEKVLGAHRAQITKVILPWANRKDVALEIRSVMEFVFVRTDTLGWRNGLLMLESRSELQRPAHSAGTR